MLVCEESIVKRSPGRRLDEPITCFNPLRISHKNRPRVMEEMKDWPLMERKRLLCKMRVFQTGLSALVANGHVPSWLDEGEAERMLMEAGEELLLAHQTKREEKRR